MTNKNLDIAIETWRFFVEAHPDADMEAVVKHIAEETRKLTLQEVGEWLKLHWVSRSTDDIGTYELLISHFEPLLETLKRGKMPDDN